MLVCKILTIQDFDILNEKKINSLSNNCRFQAEDDEEIPEEDEEIEDPDPTDEELDERDRMDDDEELEEE